ncbi:hypothetical protein ACER0C_014831 [Sarotherodon galilaeus]
MRIKSSVISKELRSDKGASWGPLGSHLLSKDLSCGLFSIFLFFLPRLKTEDKKTEEKKKSDCKSTKGQWHSSPFVEAPDINVKRTAVLCALPVYLWEEDPEFFKTCNEDALDESTLIDTPVALLTVVKDGASQSSPFYFLKHGCCDAFALLFGLIYALHLDYPRKLVHTFTFVQNIFMGLDDGKPLKPLPTCS